MEVSSQQQELKLTVTQGDYEAARRAGLSCSQTGGATPPMTRLPSPFAVNSALKSGSVSVGMNRIHVFDGDAAEDQLVAAYHSWAKTPSTSLPSYDLGLPVALPLEIVATLEEIERKKVEGAYGSYDVIEYTAEAASAAMSQNPNPSSSVLTIDRRAVVVDGRHRHITDAPPACRLER